MRREHALTDITGFDWKISVSSQFMILLFERLCLGFYILPLFILGNLGWAESTLTGSEARWSGVHPGSLDHDFTSRSLPARSHKACN